MSKKSFSTYFWLRKRTLKLKHCDLKSDNQQYNRLVCWDKWLVNQASDVSFSTSFFIISCRLRALKTLYFHSWTFIKKWKNKLKRFLQTILQEIMKKKMLGTSTSHLSQPTSKPVYYIVDCRIFAMAILIIFMNGIKVHFWLMVKSVF